MSLSLAVNAIARTRLGVVKIHQLLAILEIQATRKSQRDQKRRSQ